MRCTHGCSHYHPERPYKDRCDYHRCTYEIIDKEFCQSFDGKPYPYMNSERPAKRVKQPDGAWNTSLDVYLDFPYRCQSFQDRPRSHVVIDEREHIVAFNCDCYPTMKGTSEECLGEKCPHCRLVQIEEYEKIMKSE